MYESVLFERDGGVATITLNRPESMNAFDERLIDDAGAAMALCERDRDIRAVIITGAGRAFSAGGDLDYHESMDKSALALANFWATHLGQERVAAPIRRMLKPVIAAVNGAAAGGGFGIAAACDLRIASTTAKFRVAFGGIGLSPDAGLTHTLPRLLGHAKAMELYLFNEVVLAEEALRIGLVNRVVDPPELLPMALSIARRLAAGPTFAFGQTKALMNRGVVNDFFAQLSEETRTLGLCATTSDHEAAVKAFLAKRPAQFEGR